MNPVSRFLIGTGILLVMVGLLWQWGGKFLHLGRLPGDIAIERENFSFYFPVVTCILLSLILSLVLYLIRFFGKK